MPNQRSTGKNYSEVSVKSPALGERLRRDLAPDSPASDAFAIPVPGVGPNDAKCQGSVPSTPGVTVSPISMPVDNNRVPGRSGDAGPM